MPRQLLICGGQLGLLHWTFGMCEAMAEVLCFEPDGRGLGCP